MSTPSKGQRPVTDKRGGYQSYAPDELCAAAGCTTVLSRYNSTNMCAQHDPRHH